MSERSNAEVVSELQRGMSRVETAVYHTCHLKANVYFGVSRRDGETVFEASTGDWKVIERDPLALIVALGAKVFEDHVDKIERARWSDVQR
jgi:hypothetical protein